MSEILNSALTGDADFAGNIFNTPAPEPTKGEPPAAEPKDAPEPVVETPKEEAPKEEKKAPVKTEPKTEKKPKASKEEVEKTVADITKKVSSEDTTEKSNENSEDDGEDLPLNPHFADKPVADRPEGDDSEKGISSWKEIKSELKKIREQRDEAVAKLKVTEEEKAKISQVEVESFKKEIEDYKTKLAELNRELKAANFERSPEYIESVKKPLSGLQGDLKAIADANDADFSKLWQALTEPDVRKRTDSLENLIGDFKRMEQLSIVKMADKYHELAQYHERFQREAESLTEAEAARRAQAEQEFIENDLRLQKTFTAKTWTGLEDRYDFLREIDGQTEWNNRLVNARKSAAETNLDRLSVEERSAILAKAAVVPFLESAVNHYSNQLKAQVEARDKKIAELEEQVKSFVGATPSLGSSVDDSSDDEEMDDKKLTNFGASIIR
jgi:hypothetical protein